MPAWLHTRAATHMFLSIALVAMLASGAALVGAGVTLRDRGRGVEVTCEQVKRLRADIVSALETARAISLRYGRPAYYTDRQERERRARVRATYAEQLARIRPTHCP